MGLDETVVKSTTRRDSDHMDEKISKTSATVLANVGDLLPDLESVYKDLHAHPELSMQENRTAGIGADRLRTAGYDVTTGIGKFLEQKGYRSIREIVSLAAAHKVEGS